MAAWTPQPKAGETWTGRAPAGGSWTDQPKQNETWAANVRQPRGFDPAGFDNAPSFDTGSTAGVWSEKPKHPETWTNS